MVCHCPRTREWVWDQLRPFIDKVRCRPPTLRPARRKRRAGGRITTDFNLEADLASEGTQRLPFRQRDTPRKRALFGRVCGGNGSPTVDLTEAQAGRSADDDSPEWAHSSGVGLMDTVTFGPLVQPHRGGAILASALAPDCFYIDENAPVCGVNELGSVPTSI